jgi:3-hydroxybutyryl-CoA dehydrogenase
LRKTPVDCPDTTGFIVNYLLFPYLGRALTLLERGVVDAAALDAALEEGHEYPMGPFALLDTIGLDVSLTIQRELSAAYGEPDFAPSALLTGMVAAGMLGRKNRRGLRTAG